MIREGQTVRGSEGYHADRFLLVKIPPRGWDRRRGLDWFLPGQAIAETYAGGGHSITVCTDPANGPLEFYRRLGFSMEVYRQARYLYRPTD